MPVQGTVKSIAEATPGLKETGLRAKRARVMLVGLGPHARRIYTHYLTAHDADLRVVVELASRREEVIGFLAGRNIDADTCFLEPSCGESGDLSAGEEQMLDRIVAAHGITHAINSAASHTHFAYLKYFISRGIPVLTDKPITAPHGVISRPEMARKIEEEYRELCTRYLSARPRGAKVEVQCQRRYHPAYVYVRDLIRTLVERYSIPVTHVDIYHCDGMWNMPDEYLFRENHAYKYGYGKLFHSGYHFIDLLAWLLEASTQVPDRKIPDSAELYAAAVRPADALQVIDDEDYRRLFGEARFAPFYDPQIAADFDGMGEVDFHSTIQLKNVERVITTCNLALLQSGFSRRAWTQLPEDTYKGNGRVRHERVNIQIGPLANIQIHSYQAREAKERTASESSIGDVEHFDIHVFRNVKIIGGEPVRTLTWRDLGAARERDGHFIGYNEQAKEKCMTDFLCGGAEESDLLDHARSIRLLSMAYLALAQRAQGGSPIVNFDWRH